MKNKLVKEIREEIDLIPIIDTHEHLRKQEDIKKEGVNLFTSLKYSIVWPDFISAGMSPKEWESSSVNPKKGWEKIKPFITSVQTTGHFSTLMIAYRDLFGFKDKEITDHNWKDLSDRISNAYNSDDLYESVIKRLNIDKMLIDIIEDPGSLDMPSDLDNFVPTLAIDPLIFVKSKKFYIANPYFSPQWFKANPLENLLKKWNVSFKTFDEYLSLIDLAFKKIRGVGGVAIKFRFSYVRGMNVEKVEKKEAEKIFNMEENKITKNQVKMIEDFLIRTIIEKATEYKMPIQVHSGLFGNCGNDPRKGHPFQIINLFTDYPQTKFILFHGSYPFTGDMAVLVRGFPNVYLDICWTPWLLYNNLQRYISEWLALIPSNKILVGGDSECIERVYSSITVAKNCIAEVLAEHVEKGTYTRNMASIVAKKLLRDNAKELYVLSKLNIYIINKNIIINFFLTHII